MRADTSRCTLGLSWGRNIRSTRSQARGHKRHLVVVMHASQEKYLVVMHTCHGTCLVVMHTCRRKKCPWPIQNGQTRGLAALKPLPWAGPLSMQHGELRAQDRCPCEAADRRIGTSGWYRKVAATCRHPCSPALRTVFFRATRVGVPSGVRSRRRDPDEVLSVAPNLCRPRQRQGEEDLRRETSASPGFGAPALNR